MAKNLKPCAHCGSNLTSSGIYSLSEDHPEYCGDDTRMVEVRCVDCHIGVSYITDLEYSETLLNQLIEQWNRRAPPWIKRAIVPPECLKGYDKPVLQRVVVKNKGEMPFVSVVTGWYDTSFEGGRWAMYSEPIHILRSGGELKLTHWMPVPELPEREDD